MKPADRCCCSSLAGQYGACQGCCGPPIYYAARSVVVLNLFSAMIFTVVSLFSKSLPLDIATRIWDNYLLVGEPFMIRYVSHSLFKRLSLLL